MRSSFTNYKSGEVAGGSYLKHKVVVKWICIFLFTQLMMSYFKLHTINLHRIYSDQIVYSPQAHQIYLNPRCTICSSQLRDVFDSKPKMAAHASGCTFKHKHLSFHHHRVLLALTVSTGPLACHSPTGDERRTCILCSSKCFYYARLQNLLPVSKKKMC